MTDPGYDLLSTSWDMASLPRGPLADLYDYWDGKRAGRPWPARVDIDPLDIPHLLKYLLLLDVERLEPMRLRFRLVGSNFHRFFGRDMTGKIREEAQLTPGGPGMGLAAMMVEWREVLRRGAPRWASTRQYVESGGLGWVRFTGLALPLVREESPAQDSAVSAPAADMLLLGTVYQPDDAA